MDDAITIEATVQADHLHHLQAHQVLTQDHTDAETSMDQTRATDIAKIALEEEISMDHTKHTDIARIVQEEEA